MVNFFDMEQTLAYGGLCYCEGGNYGKVGPTSKVTTPLAWYIDDIINDLIQIFMVNKKSCGNLRMCVKCLIVATAALIIVICIHFITNRQYIKSLFITIIQRNKYIYFWYTPSHFYQFLNWTIRWYRSFWNIDIHRWIMRWR